ncbi:MULTISPECIES: Crp/Fnr family transcriptional regulator [unclassified Pseudanabaena]|uniref:Crp/Fnr family transcriptional regulator n=1 Tax=unclassified Pseudanabaena TaxID=2593292 RepID=UPI0006D86005|nr:MULTISPECIES: Crp/Fnr family transcriptional regulator [unclassified Pseudanabaena]TYQ30563.1 Crp/Fnr family transcriptional regulator [Pseudanabaena sp. UWO310]
MIYVETAASHVYKRREMISRRDNYLWKIESGVVRSLTWTEDGQVICSGLWAHGDVIGSELTNLNPYEMECLTDVQLTEISRSHWGNYVNEIIRHSQTNEFLLKISHCRAKDDALRQLLGWLTNRFGEDDRQGRLIGLQLTHQEIAELIGSTRVTVTRIINDLEKGGFLSRKGRKLLFLADSSEQWHYEI